MHTCTRTPEHARTHARPHTHTHTVTFPQRRSAVVKRPACACDCVCVCASARVCVCASARVCASAVAVRVGGFGAWAGSASPPESRGAIRSSTGCVARVCHGRACDWVERSDCAWMCLCHVCQVNECRMAIGRCVLCVCCAPSGRVSYYAVQRAATEERGQCWACREIESPVRSGGRTCLSMVSTWVLLRVWCDLC